MQRRGFIVSAFGFLAAPFVTKSSMPLTVSIGITHWNGTPTTSRSVTIVGSVDAQAKRDLRRLILAEVGPDEYEVLGMN